MEITPMVSMAAESTDTERAQTSASQLVHCAQHASAVEWMCAGSCACARSKTEKHAHLKDVAPLPVEALESLVRPCPLIEFTCSKRDPSHWIQKMGASELPTRLPV